MKHVKLLLIMVTITLLAVGCSKEERISVTPEAAQEAAAAVLQTETVKVIHPLPDTTMDNLTDAILSVSLEEGNAYVDDTGKMQMDVKIYSYDQFDLVDISQLKVGDTIVTNAGEVEVRTLDQTASGTVYINGGLDGGGMELVTDDFGIFYESGFNDHKNWYEVGEATIRVSTDFIFTDNADLHQGEAIYYPGSFLNGEVPNYDFTPYNTTIRVENGQIVEMNRRYIP